MSEDKNYHQLIKFRNVFKRLNQSTWTIRNSEKRWHLGEPEKERMLLSIYKAIRDEVVMLADELKSVEQEVEKYE